MAKNVAGLAAALTVATLPAAVTVPVAASNATAVNIAGTGKYDQGAQEQFTNYSFSFSYDDATLPSITTATQKSFYPVLTSPFVVTDVLGTSQLTASQARIFVSNGEFKLSGFTTSGQTLMLDLKSSAFALANGLPTATAFAGVTDFSTSVLLNGGSNSTGRPSSLSINGVPTVTPTPSVPEPASWAMMVGGFGLVGAALRRRKAMKPAVA